MIKIIKEKWAKNESKLREKLGKKAEKFSDLEEVSYKSLLELTLNTIYNSDLVKGVEFLADTNNITEVNDGSYNGTIMFLIPFDDTSPSQEDYLLTYVNYGSCSYCDTLQRIKFDLEYDYKSTEETVNDLLTLCRDMMVRLIRPYYYGEEWTTETIN